MKALILSALVAVALGGAQTYNPNPIGPFYATMTSLPFPANGPSCSLNAGYAIRFAGPNAAPYVNSTIMNWLVETSPAPNGIAPFNCYFPFIAGALDIFHLACAVGWTPVSTFPNGVASLGQATGVWAAATAYNAAGGGSNGATIYDFGVTTTFVCNRNLCPYTCSGAGCVIGATGNLASNTSAQICACGWFPSGVGDNVNIFTCPIAGIATNTPLTCSNTASAAVTIPQQNIVARSAIVRTIPTQCNCGGSSASCPSINSNSPTCTGCAPCTLGGSLTGQRVVFCAGLTTWAAIEDCLHQAACAGVIRTGFDTCVVSSDFCTSANAGNSTTGAYVFDQTLTLPFTCPTCPGKSKKLLLLLLLLLLLIPAFLCSLLCCLFFLCCIRRKKKGVPAHMATFDAGAAPLQPIFTHHDHVVPSHHHTVTQLDHAHGFLY